MKSILYKQIVNLLGILFLANTIPYFTFLMVLKFSIVAALVAIVGYCFWASDRCEEDLAFKVFMGAVIFILDIIICYFNQDIILSAQMIIMLFLTNSFFYWLLKDLLIIPPDNQKKNP